MRITAHPPRRSGRGLSTIRLLPRVIDGKPLVRPRVTEARGHRISVTRSSRFQPKRALWDRQGMHLGIRPRHGYHFRPIVRRHQIRQYPFPRAREPTITPPSRIGAEPRNPGTSARRSSSDSRDRPASDRADSAGAPAASSGCGEVGVSGAPPLPSKGDAASDQRSFSDSYRSRHRPTVAALFQIRLDVHDRTRPSTNPVENPVDKPPIQTSRQTKSRRYLILPRNCARFSNRLIQWGNRNSGRQGGTPDPREIA